MEPSFLLLIYFCCLMKAKVVLVLAEDTKESQNPNLLHSVCRGTNKGHL